MLPGADAISSLPLSVTVPAATTLAAYLNARFSFFYDVKLVSSIARAVFRRNFWSWKGRANLFYNLEGHALDSKMGSQPFLVYQGKTWTFQETYQTVLRYGNWLKKTHNVRPGDVIALDFMNCPAFLFMWMGLWSIGAIPSMINYNLTKAPLEHCVRICDAKLLIVEGDLRSQFPPEQVAVFNTPGFKRDGGSIEVIFHDSELESQILTTDAVRPPDSDRGNQELTSTCMFIYTSGTTGLPKAAIITWSKAITGATFMHEAMDLRQTDRVYTCMPLYHSTAGILGFGCCLLNGTSLAIGRKFSARNFWNEVNESEATVVQYVGETLRYLLATPPRIDPVTGEDLDKKHKVRMAYGNGLRPDVWDRFKKRFGVETVAELYGATEGLSLSLNVSSNDYATGAIGRNGSLGNFLLQFSTIVIELDPLTELPRRDKSGLCILAASGEPGELLYAVDADDIEKKFPGYINNKEANTKKILRDVRKKGDAWFRTGDMVRWSADGLWYFSDRLGDTFRWRSENVSTNEVSEILGKHPEIHEANVYGVEVPHHDGRAGCAALIFKDQAQATDPNSILEPSRDILRSLATHASSNLPKYAVPLFLRVTAAMQATGNNKQQKTTLRMEGIDPVRLENSNSTDRMYWLRNGSYVPFGKKEWQNLQGGNVRL
ncbi:long-chain fatty acid transporter fat1 [Ophidiomyces ophidiicola]|uniref:Long-chain fatty acid transporter fat1 n=1 Tax=Ophidiomyces ophidiicola TaxID=1387563 RepID=A0ACB8V7L6_9EURO|nr:long-chain fatty acid transporter fat1 [Ophidiomyces ophidiicola]KAI1946683.1 long-chain fatty acid transporter fat1 [Ophidiomyces ophidiicola]KAI1947460.1 long-chain fatty acid transporter fat1 [Ophidiomyces ophidiicola]KAI1975500.1 long-chain fatty acid transporter fat1 [Ophidiomyces ophidiicola]KAI1977259.1 long-chain fatty acid transporter fat1 [Ophidiomyces ophidiicola]KAI1991490.1 long-chain fatty acid transporter fat1 [Ophidiomyces ophidiicola]